MGGGPAPFGEFVGEFVGPLADFAEVEIMFESEIGAGFVWIPVHQLWPITRQNEPLFTRNRDLDLPTVNIICTQPFSRPAPLLLPRYDRSRNV